MAVLRLYSLMISKSLWLAVGAIFIGSIIALAVWGIDPDPSEFRAAASLHQSAVHLDQIPCVLVDEGQVIFDQKEYRHPMLQEVISAGISVSTVLLNADYSACAWGIRISGEKIFVSAIRYGNEFARYRVAVAVCERALDGRMNPNKCLSKNIYVFNPRVETHELLSLALAGLARPQTEKLESFRQRRLQ